ncbi:Pregnancy zone protein [Lamellibrachia satsuma]|nr:Pregnancy zone protein [Lamellibrachia satsuma]
MNLTPAASDNAAANSKIENAIRNYFPETWLPWDLIDVGSSGMTVVKLEVPHTITEWIGNMFCSNAASGLGVSPPATLKAFQPFFLSFTLPYSIVLGEKVVIPITVFSYLPGCMVVQLTMKKAKGLEVLGPRETYLCVCGNQAKTHRYTISVRLLGEVDLTVRAKSVNRDGVCGNGVDMVSESKGRDIVTRVLLVEPEGREVEYTHSQFVCPTDRLNPIRELVSLRLAENLAEVVPGSARGYVSVIGT